MWLHTSIPPAFRRISSLASFFGAREVIHIGSFDCLPDVTLLRPTITEIAVKAESLRTRSRNTAQLTQGDGSAQQFSAQNRTGGNTKWLNEDGTCRRYTLMRG